MVGGKHAGVVVACLFAGVGAWGAAVSVTNNDTIYASELFGEGHSSPEYPEGKDPKVVLFIPKNVAANPTATPPVKGVDHNGSVEITFTLTHGAVFNADIGGLMWNTDTDADPAVVVPAPEQVASFVSGGRKGDSSLTIKVGEVASDETGRQTDNDESISFTLPRLANLGALAGANPKAPSKSIYLTATSRIISGAFTNGPLTGVAPHHVVPVVNARDSLTLKIEASNDGMSTIAIDDDAAKGMMAFKTLKETIGAGKAGAGHVELATVTVMTKQVKTPPVMAAGQKVMYHVDTSDRADTLPTDDPPAAGAKYDQNQTIFKEAVTARGAIPYDIYDLDGEKITAEGEGLRGSFSVMASGTRELFNEGDMLFVDYDRNGKMGPGEQIAIDGSTAMGDALSIDADKSDSFDKDGTGMFKVYYMPGGKDSINHGAMINLTAMVDYSDPSAIDETPEKSSTTLNFDGVGNPLRAYAIPHSTNGTGDKGNVRVRCEASAGCRVFLECWDDMGMRGFGEAPMIAGDSVMVWSGEAIEDVTGMEPTSRHSCRVLSKGMVTVQQLTRDGNSGTLVNNTYVGGGM